MNLNYIRIKFFLSQLIHKLIISDLNFLIIRI
jgi:hypothetical protein